jgi:hypothetical protein
LSADDDLRMNDSDGIGLGGTVLEGDASTSYVASAGHPIREIEAHLQLLKFVPD